MPKPTRTASQLQAFLQERIDQIPDLRGQVTDVQLGGVIWMEAGTEGGANWTVPVLRSRDVYRADIARIIRQVQGQFDLEE